MSLYLATVGYALAGDHRVAQELALLIGAVLIYRCRPGLRSALAGALMLFTPRVFFILISGWTEPFVVLLLALTLYCAARKPKWLPIALGLLLAAKQYLVLLLPLSVLLVRTDRVGRSWLGWPLPEWRVWLKLIAFAVLTAAAATLPLALWNWPRFHFSVVTVQQYAPFRWDALSYLVWRAFGHGPPSTLATFLWPIFAVGLATILCLRRSPRTPGGFAASAALVFLAFFAFNKQAFANYYFFVIAAFCASIAAVSDSTSIKRQPGGSGQ
jgi:hypothetical protein